MSGATQPAFLVVDDDIEIAAALEKALNRRFGADYKIIAERSPERGLAVLARLRDREEQVAVVIADEWMPRMTGVDFLRKAHQMHPAARRALLFDAHADRDSQELLLRAMALGRVDAWLVKPWEPADHHLYLRVSELLDEWVQVTGQPGLTAMRIVAEPRAPRTHELRDFLDRNDEPAVFVPPESPQGRELLMQAGQGTARLPVVVYFDGQVLQDPTDKEIAEAAGVRTHPGADSYDIAVVGAGPAGLSAALSSASEGRHTLVLESRTLGGQASSTSMIRNYLGFPRGVSGRKLRTLACDQTAIFGSEFVFDRAIRLRVRGGQPVIDLASGAHVRSDVVILSVGVEYRRLAAPGVNELTGAGVFYGAAVSEAQATCGQPVYIVGAGNSAGQAAVHLAKYASHVTILVRGHSLSATMSDYLVRQIEDTPNITVCLGTQVTSAGGAGRLEHLTLHDAAAGRTRTVRASALFILIGAQPNTEWLTGTLARDSHGFLLTGPDLCPDSTLPAGWPLPRPPLPMETSIPGVFAVGDVRHRSAKRVACAVGEGATIIQYAHQHLDAIRTTRPTGPIASRSVAYASL
jgi:thioredoxin reductase (NADPH)